MAKQFSDFYGKIQRNTGNCPTPIIDEMILETIIDFCERTDYIRKDLTPIDVVAGTAEYDLSYDDIDSIHDVWNVITAKYDDVVLESETEDHLDLDWPKIYSAWFYSKHRNQLSTPWRTLTSTQPLLYFLPEPKVIRLIGIPTENLTSGLDVKASLKPKRSASTFDNILYDECYEVIANGVISRVRMIPDQSWTEYNIAKIHEARYEGDIDNYRGRANRSHTRSKRTVLRTKPQP